MRLAALPILAALLAPLPVAAAGLIDAANPERLALKMIELGFPASVGVDGAGDPKITSSAAGANFTVFFYDCTDGAKCRAVQFQAGFNMATPTTAAKMNQWNREHRFGAAYMDDEGDPILQMDFNLTGGVSAANFADTIDWWKVVLGEFQTYIEW